MLDDTATLYAFTALQHHSGQMQQLLDALQYVATVASLYYCYVTAVN
jgi:hypothetical protein